MAKKLYLEADLGISYLPSDCQLGVRAARYIYSEIGEKIKENDYDSVSQRAYVPLSRKLLLLLSASVESILPSFSSSSEPCEHANAVSSSSSLPPSVSWETETLLPRGEKDQISLVAAESLIAKFCPRA